MNEPAEPLRPITGDVPMPSPHWHIREVGEPGSRHYQVVASAGTVVASGIKSLELARLFALSPQLFENFRMLRLEAERALYNMVDCDITQCDIKEIAEDEKGQWDETAPGASAFATWLLDLEELAAKVGSQGYPPEGVATQADLFRE